MMKHTLILFIFLLFGCVDQETQRIIQNARSTPFTNNPEIVAFRDPDSLIEKLESIPNFQFLGWYQTNNERSEIWSRHSPIIPIGTYSKDGLKNEIAISLLSANKKHVNKIQIELRLKNPEEKDEAFYSFAVQVIRIMEKIGISTSDDLSNALLNERSFAYENSSYFIYLMEMVSVDSYFSTITEETVDFNYRSYRLSLQSK